MACSTTSTSPWRRSSRACPKTSSSNCRAMEVRCSLRYFETKRSTSCLAAQSQYIGDKGIRHGVPGQDYFRRAGHRFRIREFDRAGAFACYRGDASLVSIWRHWTIFRERPASFPSFTVRRRDQRLNQEAPTQKVEAQPHHDQLHRVIGVLLFTFPRQDPQKIVIKQGRDAP